MPSNPSKRSGTIRGIAGTNIFVATISFFFHIFSFVWTLREPHRISEIGQTELVVYIGMVIMILISLILVIASWRLFISMGAILTNPEAAIRTSKSWKRWIACFLTFFIIALLILVLSSGKQVSRGVIQNYMVFLLVIISFSIFGMYYVGRLLKEMESPDPFTTTIENPNNASCFDNLSSGANAIGRLPDPEIANISQR